MMSLYLLIVGNKPYTYERDKQVFVIPKHVSALAEELAKELAKLAYSEDINKGQEMWLFSVAETLGEIYN